MIAVERAKSEDVDSIKRVLSETWIDTYANYLSRSTIEYVTTNWHDPNLLRSQIENPGGCFAVAKDDGRVIGLVTVVSVGQNELYLARLYVHPHYQRRGIGTDLLNAALQLIRMRLQFGSRSSSGTQRGIRSCVSPICWN